MTRERIKDFKEIVLPFFTNYLLKKNHENLGKSDAEEFEKDFSEIIELADKALEQMNSSENQGNWIPVSKRMPEPRIDVWCNSDMGQMVGYYDEYAETWYGRDYLELIVTAWMPLPEPYREERTEE